MSVGVTDQVAQFKAQASSMGWPEPVVYTDNDISAHRGGFEQLLARRSWRIEKGNTGATG